MKVVFYTSSVTGFGRLMMGVSIGNSLKRKNIKCQYTILSNSVQPSLVHGIDHIGISTENENQLSKENYQNSNLYRTLLNLNPDVLIINHLWFTLYNFIHELKFLKIYLSDLVDDRFFSITLEDKKIKFRNSDFDRVIAIEPFNSVIKMERINPLLPRNKDEIFSKKVALEKLDKDGSKRLALYGLDGHEFNTNDLRKKFLYLEDIGFDLIYPTKYGNSIYPNTDYYNALDFLVYGAGYTQFWDAIFFNKEAVFIPFKVRFSDQAYRVQHCQEHYFEENGADQLVDIIMGM